LTSSDSTVYSDSGKVTYHYTSMGLSTKEICIQKGTKKLKETRHYFSCLAPESITTTTYEYDNMDSLCRKTMLREQNNLKKVYTYRYTRR
jgi:hypothetical protein